MQPDIESHMVCEASDVVATYEPDFGTLKLHHGALAVNVLRGEFSDFKSWLDGIQQKYFRPRKERFLQTFTGRAFYPLSPRPEDVCIEDIAHALSMQCRYNGHCIEFYSVAEHGCLLYDYVQQRFDDPILSWWAVMHDSSEAIVGDMIRPIKDYMPFFTILEDRVMGAICDAFRMQQRTMPPIIHDLDKRIIADERSNMKPMDWGDFEVEPLGVELKLWSPARAKEEFLKRFNEVQQITGDLK